MSQTVLYPLRFEPIYQYRLCKNSLGHSISASLTES
jgi:hypothetical protein